jgi:glycosyltransferase involved in cell wall biosynthesis
MNRFHAFWAPTPFIAEALKQLTDKPIALVPPYLPWMTKRADSARRTAETFPHFLYCFDANSIVERKNPGLLLDAFLAAFPQGSGARLTFKVTYPNRSLAEIERLYAAAAQYEGIEVVDDLLSDDDILKLIASATAYVSPHRSEGLGLTIVEAMALGTPVIATPFSGVAQFVTPRTAWPIDYRLVELDDNFGPYPKGFVWADPRLDSLVSALRSVIAKPEQAAKRASAAKSCVLDHFASPAVLQTYRKALDQTARTIGV